MTAQAGADDAAEQLRIAHVCEAAGKGIELEVLDALSVAATARETAVKAVAIRHGDRVTSSRGRRSHALTPLPNISKGIMKTIVSLALASLAIASSATPTLATSKSGLTVSAAFQPSPPKQGVETIIVTVKDALGRPVKGAIVTVGSNMPTMSMSGPSSKARDNGNGTYTAKTIVNFATKWTFDVVAAAEGQKAHTQLSADVK